MFALGIGLISALAGVIAAFYWLRASRVPSLYERLEMMTRPDDLMDLYWKLRQVADDGLLSAKLNRIAALWTAASVLLAGTAALATTLA